MVVAKDRPHGPRRSVPKSIVVECEDHSAIQAPQNVEGRYKIGIEKDKSKKWDNIHRKNYAPHGCGRCKIYIERTIEWEMEL